MKNFKFLNNLFGWLSFAIAAVVYLLTIEPTVSFWDCGEFITTAYKLEVGHPPGAPFFMILGRFFTLFAGSETAVAAMINTMSALASAFTILFLFWTISHLAKRLVISRDKEPDLGQTIAILGAALVGSLAYTFSDTFWFSAVEGEVYATSSLITALVFWAILKWEDVADEPFANRWLVLIAYIVGLSIGVHLLNLLAIPAIVFVYYFRKYEVTRKGIIYSILISLVLLGVVMYGVIPGVVTIASWFELLFVNSFGLPFNTGVMIYGVLMIAAIVLGIRYTIRKKMVLWNTVLLGLTVILIGYSSFAMIVIRSSSNLPMDQNNPDDVFSLLYYLNREQYGDRPLFMGQNYNTPQDAENPYTKGKKAYIQKDGKYVVAEVRQHPNYDSNFTSVLPRMWSSDPKHVKEYKKWANIKGRKIKYTNANGEVEMIEQPSLGDNLKFLFRYQIGHMYVRYFMWNFVGRQNDIQGNGGILKGNWISGIDFIDSARLGSQVDLPQKFADNPGRNKYYFLPFLLGLLGIFYQYNKGKQGKKDLWVVTLLFFMTGLAIVFYLNQYPLQPRERDYAFAGSFYAFAIWIGLGVLAINDLLKKYTSATVGAGVATVLSLVLVPGLMAAENWDDHDRSGRYVARDFGRNYLESCEPNAIIFTNGDNDTFPLWYAQEVEGVRTDVRVCNLSYLQTDWYIEQMMRKAYDSEPMPLSLELEQVEQGKRNVIYLFGDARVKRNVGVKEAVDFVISDSPATKLRQYDNAAYLPTKKFELPINKETIFKNNVVPEKDSAQIVDKMVIDLSRRPYMTKDELVVFDLLTTNDWKRPIYYAITVGRDKYLSLENYFQVEGLAYRLVPVKTENEGPLLGRMNTDKVYYNLMEKFKWGNMSDPDVYLDENHRRMALNVRNNFSRLAAALVEEGKKDSVLNVLKKCQEVVPLDKVPYDYYGVLMAKSYIQVGAVDKAMEIFEAMKKDLTTELDYYLSLEPRFVRAIDNDMQFALYLLREIALVATEEGQKEYGQEAMATFATYYKAMGGSLN
ncbi:DUF2723 domain-containing protein [Puteibacter caeruleilacunae]|nr:DUF2723 domain-containing protein [Puteibacter caeruleilacunae]